MMTKITHTFNEEEISKLSVGEKIQKGYYEVINEEEWQKDMQTKYGNMSAELEKVKKENDLIKNYIQQIRSVIQSANFEQICTEYRVKIIKIMDNLLYRTDFKLIDTDKERLEKQLIIAVAALETYTKKVYIVVNDSKVETVDYADGGEIAEKALKQIKELNK